MRYDQDDKSVNAMICNGSYLEHWGRGIPMYSSRKKIQKHIDEIEHRIEQKAYGSIEELRNMDFSLTAAEELQE